jgi:hypothetical protein
MSGMGRFLSVAAGRRDSNLTTCYSGLTGRVWPEAAVQKRLH